MLFGMTLTGCGKNNGNNNLSEIYSTYQSNGGTLSYDDWLASIQDGKSQKGEPGPQGPAGQDGVSIASILKTGTDGLVDTYTITYSNGTTSTFTVTNGADGQDGAQGSQGIQGNPGADGHTPAITVGNNGNWFVDGVDSGVHAQGIQGETGPQGPQGNQGPKGDNGYTPYIGENGNWWINNEDTGYQAIGHDGANGANGQNGTNGADGVSITGITKINTTDNVDTYQITFSNDDTFEFSVTNGTNGVNGQDGTNGQDGKTPHIGENGNWWIGDEDTGYQAIGHDGANGVNGQDGADGIDGKDGKDGKDGVDGVSINGITLLSSEGNIDTYRITFSNGEHFDFDIRNGIQGETGPQGETGATGTSITNSYIDENGDLIVEFSDGSSTNAGHVKDTDVFTVTFHLGETIVSTKQVIKGETVSRPTHQEIRGYNVTDWYIIDGSNHESWKFFTYPVMSDIDLYAEYTELEICTISFIDTDHGQSASSIELYTGDEYSLPTLTYPKYSFVGWKDSNENLWEQNGVFNLTTNTTLHAVWNQVVFTIYLDANGGAVSADEVDVVPNESYSLPIPKKPGFVFLGWFDENSYQFPNQGTWNGNSNLKLTANWAEAGPALYTYDLDGGKCESNSVVIAYGSEYTLPTPFKSGYFFNGWFLNDGYVPNDGKWTFSDQTGTLKVHWLPTSAYTLTLKSTNTYRIDSCSYSSSDPLIVPSEFNELSIDEINSNCFMNNTQLVNIVLPNTITSIGSCALRGCSSLESLTIPFVGSSPTADTSALTVFGYIFGDSSYSGGVATSQYYSKDSSKTYYIPSSLKEVKVTGGNIKYGAFSNCSSLTSISISGSTKYIGSYAFRGCSSLESLTIPFVGSSPTATTASASTVFGYIFGDTSYKGGVATKQVYGIGYGDNKTYYIPSSLKEVKVTGGNMNSDAFYNCSSLTSIIIPDSVTTIPRSAFFNCSSLTSFTIPNSVTLIGANAFNGCSSLTSIFIPDSVTRIYSAAFKRCSSLTSITIPDSVTTIEDYAFYECSSLTSITIPDGVKAIEIFTFAHCSSLASIIIPDSVTNFDQYAIEDCPSKLAIYFQGDAAAWSNISISGNGDLTVDKIYYYSEALPEDAGNYWHYVNGVPTKW